MRVIVHPCLDLGTPDAGRIEVVERKGAGHPDTLCDGLAERLSAALSRHYLERFGEILHHNVDKALLVGGVARPELGGGEIIEPIEITLAGRAVRNVGADRIPIEEIAIEESRRFIRETFRELDPERHVKIQCRIRPGSLELSELFARRTGTRWLANDTSCGVGFSPLSPLEALVLELDRDLASSELRDAQPWSGEDLKLMATRIDQSVELAIARAMIGRHLRSLDEYVAAKQRLAQRAVELARLRFPEVRVSVNAADDLERGSIYLTVTGTSAEAGDDGQVGRGNRVGGLITPYRAMTMEAAAGKNPVSHVGKLYNVAAREIASALTTQITDVAGATCVLVSRIGRPVEEPELVDVRVRTLGYRSLPELRPRIDAVIQDELAKLPDLWQRLVRGEIAVY